MDNNTKQAQEFNLSNIYLLARMNDFESFKSIIIQELTGIPTTVDISEIDNNIFIIK